MSMPKSVSPLMQELSVYVADAVNRRLPRDVIEKGKFHLLDTLAAIVSGSRILPGERAIAYIKTLGGPKESCVVGTRVLTSTASAALANGMFAHADETDDSHAPSLSHPGCAVVPAALAIGEREGVSGKALLRAVILGYEVNCRVVLALGPVSFFQAGHSSHSFGAVFGAAVAAGALARLNARQVRYLFSYTAQQASGVSCFLRDEEHIEKAFDLGGMPARNGVTAANMVTHGFTGVEDVFSGERNFFYAYSPSPKPGQLVRKLGERFEIMSADIKRWPVGSPIQAPVNSLLTLITQHKIKADDVEHLVVRVGLNEATYVNDRAQLTNNMQHMLAILLLDGKLTFESCHDNNRIKDRRVIEMKRRIKLIGSREITDARPRRQGIIEITTRNGRLLIHRTRAVKGTAYNPMTRAELEEKCLGLTIPVLGTRRARRLIKSVWNIEQIENVRNLRSLLMV